MKITLIVLGVSDLQKSVAFYRDKAGFDLQNQFDLLANARLYIPDLLALEKNQALMYFDIDLSRSASR